MGRLSPPPTLPALGLSLFLALVVSVPSSQPCLARPAGSAARASTYMRTSELRPGMQGYGLTVFRGTRVERFPVTILGVLRSYIGDGDLILIRVTGGYPAQHGVGIVAGMSGSPVYVNGKLIGAVAYGWPFSKEPIGGVTPIENMLKDLPPALPPGSTPSAGSERPPSLHPLEARTLPAPLRVANHVFTRVQVLPSAPRRPLAPGTLVLTPVNTLLQLRGFGPAASESLQKLLRPLHLEAVQTHAVASPPAPHPPPVLQPGAALGVRLLTGDLEISGTGTLTYLDSHRFLGFGHPMSQLGTVSLPASLACIHDILPSYNRPFKFASQVRVIGELASDRLWAVGGYLGRTAPTLPVTVRRIDRVEGRDRTYHMRATQNRFLAPPIIGSAVLQVLASDPPSAAEGTLRIRYRIQPHGHAAIEGEQMYCGAGTESSAASQVADLLFQLTANDHQALRIDSVEVEAEVLHGRHMATIQKVFTGRPRYLRGENVDVHVLLKPYGQPSVEKVVQVPIPVDLLKGTLNVGVSGGGEIANLRKRLGLSRPEPEGIGQLLRALAHSEKNQELLVKVLLPTQAAVVGEERLGLLPESLREILPSLAQGGITGERDCLEVRVDTPWVLRGLESTQVDVNLAPPPPARESALSRDPSPDSHDLRPTPVAVSPPGRRGGAERPSPPTVRTQSSPSTSFVASTGTSRQVLPDGTRRWDICDVTGLGRGHFEGTGLSRGGEVALAPAVRGVLDTHGILVWSLACASKDLAWAGYAEDGWVQAFHLPSGKRRDGFQVADAAVTALAVGSQGSLWVGTGPHGHLYHRSASGDLREMALPEHPGYVWALLPRPDGSVLVATGAPARLYQVAVSGTVRLLHSFSERHLRALVESPEGGVLAATAGPGVVYRLPSTLDATAPLFTSRYSSIDGLAVGPSGEIAATSGRDLYRLAPGRELRVVPVSDHPLLDVVSDGEGAFIAGGSGGRLFRVDASMHVLRLDATEGGPVMALRRAGSDLLAATGRPAGVVAVGGSAAVRGTWTSDVLDAGAMAHWGRIRWIQGQGHAGSITLQTRSGLTPSPDGAWSAWSAELNMTDGQAIASPAGRYLQVRARLSGTGDDPPTLAQVAVFYRNAHEAPVMALERPKAGEVLAGQVKVTWTTTGTGAEFLTYDLLCSRVGTTTWSPVQAGLAPRLKEHSPSDSAPAPGPQSNECTWDTRRVTDGSYRVKVVARSSRRPEDKPVEVLSPPFLVANSRPEIVVLKQERLAGGLGIRFQGVAKSHVAWVAAISWRQGSSDWRVAEAEDGVLDSDRERFLFTAKEGAEVEIRVTDEAGNTHSIRVPVRP